MVTASPDPADGREQDRTLAQDLSAVLNQHGIERIVGNTPDWILAEYLIDCLSSLSGAIAKRDRWYGMAPRPGAITYTVPEPPLTPPPDVAGTP